MWERWRDGEDTFSNFGINSGCELPTQVRRKDKDAPNMGHPTGNPAENF